MKNIIFHKVKCLQGGEVEPMPDDNETNIRKLRKTEMSAWVEGTFGGHLD